MPITPAIPVVRCAPGVQFAARPLPGGIRIVSAIDQATKVLGRHLLITSAADSHASGRHPTGEAYDLSVRDLDVPSVIRVLRYLQDALGPRFTALYEVPSPSSDLMLARIETVNPHATGAHIHVQVRKGTTYPPDDASVLRA